MELIRYEDIYDLLDSLVEADEYWIFRPDPDVIETVELTTRLYNTKGGDLCYLLECGTHGVDPVFCIPVSNLSAGEVAAALNGCTSTIRDDYTADDIPSRLIIFQPDLDDNTRKLLSDFERELEEVLGVTDNTPPHDEWDA